MSNRFARARENAGLNVAQAAKLLGVPAAVLHNAENSDDGWMVTPERLAELYGVNVEWLLGKMPLRDRSAINRIPGSDKLSPHDLDIVAEFAASLPRKP